MRTVDLTGKRFFRILVIEKTEIKDKSGSFLYRCKCDCGKEINLSAHVLNEKHPTKSCGCLQLENLAKVNRKPFGESAFNNLYNEYKKNAKIRNLIFELSQEQFRKITKENCYYCNEEPLQQRKLRTGYGWYTYNGIDRVDN